jgi:hypothetical protein
MSFRIPGTTEPEITVRRSALGNLAVLVNGVPAKRRHRRALSYDIPMSDGSVKELALKGQWTGLKAVVDGSELPLEPPMPPYVVILIFLPLVLVVLGGLIGALIAVGAAAINARLARGPMRSPIKVASMLAVTGVSVMLFLGAAIAIAPVPTLEAGTCVNGIREGSTVTTATTRSVDCSRPHDNEVVGSVRYAGEGAFPGQDTLLSFAETACLEAFGSYVGVDFQTSSLDMILVTPLELTWAKGDRQINCVVLAGDGGRLTGSVKGTGQ